jgi:preprotein translocase subunit SecG
MEFSIFLVLITIVCFLLIVVIMVQNPKGGGLSSSVGGSQMLGGVQKTTDFLDKSTWTLAAILIALVLLSTLSFVGNSDEKIIDTETAAPATPKDTKPAAMPTTAPATTTTPTTTPSTATPNETAPSK